MADPVNLAAVFGLPPEKAIEYFRSKGYAIGWNWHDVWQEAQAKAFTVAKAMREDILWAIRAELDSALANGTTLRDFQNALTPRLQTLGWWGKQIIVDGEGNAQVAHLGSPRRLETIFRTNLQTAYMAGRYREMMDNVQFRPWWQYVAIMDDRTRPSHAALNGRVFRYDDPIWRYYYPPNGFNCRCRVRALSDRDLKNRDIQPSSSEQYLGETWAVDKKTGFTERVATLKLPGMDRTFSPDLGWNYNPGETWVLWDRAGAAEDALPGASGGGIVRLAPGQPTWRAFGRPDLRDVPANLRVPAPGLLEPGLDAAGALDILKAAVGIADGVTTRIVKTPVENVALREELLAHLVEKRHDQRERYADYILPTLQDPFEVYLVQYEDGYRKRYIGLFTGRTDLMVVVRENQDGSLMWNIMQADDKAMNKQRQGALLYGKQ